jgi:flagellar biosynthetic protein FlhB
MPEQPAAERTEQPTAKKLQKARQKGQVPQSQELASVATLLALVAVVTLLAPNLLRWFSVQMEQGMACESEFFSDRQAFLGFVNGKVVASMVVICPILAAVAAASALGHLVVSGLNFAPEAVELKWDMINPAAGLGRLVNTKSLVRLVVSILKLLFVGLVVWFYLESRLDTLATLRWACSGGIIAAIAKIILGLLIRVGLALLVIALGDVLYQRWKYIQDLKMTRQEVKQEQKDTQGSPEVKGRIRRIQLQMALRRISAEVPKASVVLVNPTHVAVALRYEAEKMEAPMLVAKGADYLAEKIREIARAYGVPIVRRPELARTIYSTVEEGSPIPPSLYVAVAEVLAMIYRLRHSKT